MFLHLEGEEIIQPAILSGWSAKAGWFDGRLHLKRFWSWLFVLAVVYPGVRSVGAQVTPGGSAGAQQRRAAAQQFLAQRGLSKQRSTASPGVAHVLARARAARHAQPLSSATVFNLTAPWKPLGPAQTITPAYGAVTGRVTSIEIDASDTTGNTVFLGTTGGGVWRSSNAAGPAAQVTFKPMTDQAPPTVNDISSLSIGAVSVQPGGTGVVLVGTGDPNDALDSYYGQGMLRSIDHGVTWQSIDESRDDVYGTGPPHSFVGEGFAGFAWSTSTPGLVVAAVTQALDGILVNALQSNSLQGLYYSVDNGSPKPPNWQLATITDGPNQEVQGPATGAFNEYGGGNSGNGVTAVVWNKFRRMFYAAVQYHGYYSSPDGVTWTRLANQPGAGLSPGNCPPNRNGMGNAQSCPIVRGALAVQPVTGDMFAFTVAPFNTLKQGNPDQGIWQDVCAASGGVCTTGTANMFSKQLPSAPLENGSGAIAGGDYDLWLAAVPAAAGTDTLLYAGTEDIYKYSLLGGKTWQNMTNNAGGCAVDSIAPFQHAVGVAGTVPGPLMFFGNDSGLWRSTDGITQQSLCSSDLQNLNGSLGSLAEVASFAQDPGQSGTLLAAQGVNGVSGTGNAVSGSGASWPQVLDGYGSSVAIDPQNPVNWYAAGVGVSIYMCDTGPACEATDFPYPPVVGDAQTDSDGEVLLNPAVWMLDPQNTSMMIVGTCRVWRGSVASGTANWSSGNALSTVLNEPDEPACNGEAQISTLGASGTILTGNGIVTTQEILYAGMYGTDRSGVAAGGGTVAGHVFTQTVDRNVVGPANWTDMYSSLVVNDPFGGHFNPGGFTVSSVVADAHDTSGQTVYATIQGLPGNGISQPLIYRSTNQGQTWTGISANMPDIPINGLVIDPGNANIVYLATDAGVFVTTAISDCFTGPLQCWSSFGTLLPDVPITSIQAWGTGSAGLLRAASYGRGIWETPLVSALAQGSATLTTAVLNPDALVFASRPAGTLSATQTITVTNSGTAALVVSAIEVTGDYNEQDNCSGTVAVGANCVVSIAFDPQTTGVRDGVLTVLGNLPGGQATASLSGGATTAGQVTLTPVTFTFPPTAVGALSTAQYVTIANSGTVAVSLAPGVVSGAYQVAGNTCGNSDPPQTSCTVGIVFAPVASGAASGTFSMTTGTGTLTALLIGTGLSPATDGLSGSSLTSAGLQFVPQLVGTISSTQTVVISNTGSEPLTLVSASSSSSDFIVKAGCTTVPANNTCAVQVNFAPTVAGNRTGTLAISDVLHSGAGAQTIAMIGTGVARAGVPSVGPANLDFGIEGVGSISAPQTVTLTNNGNGVLTGLLFSATGNFQTSAGNCGTSLAQAASCQPDVTFTPATEGPRTGVLTITGSNQSFTTGLSGEGISFTLAAAIGVSPVRGASIETIVSGKTAVYEVNVQPVGASSGTLALACSGAPAGYTCSASGGAGPGSVQLQAGQASSITVTLAPVVSSSLRPRPASDSTVHRLWGFGTLVLACAIPLWSFPKSRLQRTSRLQGLWKLAAVLLLGGLAGCAFTTKSTGGSTGGGGGGTGTGVTTGTTDTVTLSVSAPGIKQTATITLIVEQ